MKHDTFEHKMEQHRVELVELVTKMLKDVNEYGRCSNFELNMVFVRRSALLRSPQVFSHHLINLDMEISKVIGA